MTASPVPARGLSTSSIRISFLPWKTFAFISQLALLAIFSAVPLRCLPVIRQPGCVSHAVRTRRQSIESVVNISQARLQHLSPFFNQRSRVLEQSLANVFAFSVQAVP